jgi:endonuclease/exonuclease/phosphatase family metal-dependent hydrolase
MKVLTYNIHGGVGRDGRRNYARIGQLLRKFQVDIALLQELDTRPFDLHPEKALHDLMNGHFQWIVPAPTLMTCRGWYGNAILSRFPVTRRIITDISTTGHEPRNILEAFLNTPLGPLHVVNTHKGLNPFERGRQIRKLNELLARRTEIPLFVGGDFNEWQIFAAALRQLNEALYPVRTGATFPISLPFLRLDRMWCRPRNLVRRASVLKNAETRLYSDHLPILAEIDRRGMQTERLPSTWNDQGELSTRYEY